MFIMGKVNHEHCKTCTFVVCGNVPNLKRIESTFICWKTILECAGGVEWTKDRDVQCLSNPMHHGGLNENVLVLNTKKS